MDATRPDTPVPTVALRCPRCGGDLAADRVEPHVYACAACDTRSRMTRRRALLPLGWRCDACGHDNERGNRFCTACGGALTKQCPNCGAMMLLADQFCTQCGKSRGQLVAEWYRAGRSALDAGRPWDAVAPLQRLAAVAPDYGDIPNLLARAMRDAAQGPPVPLPPVATPSPTARTVQEAVRRARGRRGERWRLLLIAAAAGVGLGAFCTLVAWLMGSVAFGALLFAFLVVLLAVNLWAAFRQM